MEQGGSGQAVRRVETPRRTGRFCCSGLGMGGEERTVLVEGAHHANEMAPVPQSHQHPLCIGQAGECSVREDQGIATVQKDKRLPQTRE